MHFTANELVQLIGVTAVVGLPSLALCARFALKPVVEAILRLREASASQPPTATAEQERRLSAVEEELRQMREGFDRLTAAVEFDAQLRAGGTMPPRLPQA